MRVLCLFDIEQAHQIATQAKNAFPDIRAAKLAGLIAFFDDMLRSHFPLFPGGPHARCPEMSSSQNFYGSCNILDKNIGWPVSEAHSLLQLQTLSLRSRCDARVLQSQ